MWRDTLRRQADAAIASMLPGGRAVAAALRRVDGYLYPHEAVLLYWTARAAPGAGDVVEVGSFRGRSTLCLAAGVLRRGSGRVHAVDPHLYGTLEELRANLERFGAAGVVEVTAQHSVEAAARYTGAVRVLFIDGDHRLEGVEQDLRAWLPRLAPGGLVLMHDSTDLSGFAGPRRVAKERLVVGETFDLTGRIGGTTWARRRGGEGDWRPPEHGKRALDPLLRLAGAGRGAPWP